MNHLIELLIALGMWGGTILFLIALCDGVAWLRGDEHWAD